MPATQTSQNLMPGTGQLASATTLRPAQGGAAGAASSYGGVSAVNPQAQGSAFANVDKYIDDSYNNAMTRLQPQMDASRNQLTQAMIDRGIGVGSDAHNKAFAQQSQNENDAMQNARFMAQQQGAALQNQMFQQDLARSQLANSLTQANMQSRLGWGNLNEQARQYDDRSAQGWDDRAFRDLSWLDSTNFRNRGYNDQQDQMWFNMRQALLGAIPGWNPAQIDVNGAANSATNSQQAAFDAQNTQNQQMWNNLGTAAGAAMMFSDPALKTNVRKLGEVNGYNWYRWEWNDKAYDAFGYVGEGQGVMADEVPEEMRGERDGFMTVDYARVLA